MQRRRGLVRIVVVAELVLALSGVVGLAQTACTRTYRGDLVLEGSQRLVITEGVLCVGGDIILRDSARLAISNAVLRLSKLEETLWDPEISIRVYDSARLVIRDTVIHGPPRPSEGSGGPGGVSVQFGAYDTARIELEAVAPAGDAYMCVNAHGWSSTLVTNCVLLEVTVQEGSALELVDCSTRHVLLGVAGTSAVTLDGLRGGHYALWSVTRGVDAAISLSLRNTDVESWGLMITEWGKVVIRDSENVSIWVATADLPDLVDGMRPGVFESWVLRGERPASAGGNLTLVNTHVAGWNLSVSERRRPIQIARSQLGLLSLGNSTTTLRIEGTTLGALLLGGSQLAVDCADLELTSILSLTDVRLSLSGALAVMSHDLGMHWDSSSVGREYEVRVRDRGGQPARGVPVRVEDPLGRVITYTSDQDGVARFTIWFSDTTYDKNWHLLVPQGDGTARIPITLLTTTPVQVTTW